MRTRALPLLAIVAYVALVALVRERGPSISPPSRDDGVTKVIVFGDSVARGAGDESGLGISGHLNAAFAARGIRSATENQGVNGARTYTLLRLLKSNAARSAIRQADAVVVSIGGNDLFGDPASRLMTFLWPARAMSRALNRVDRVAHSIRGINPQARIYLLGLYDPYRGSSLERFLDRQIAQWDGALMARFSRLPQVDVIRIADLFPSRRRLSPLDGFHPSAAAYAFIAARIASTIE